LVWLTPRWLSEWALQVSCWRREFCLVQYQSATEAEAVAKELFAENASVAASARWLWVVKFVTPGIFIVIYAAFMVALFG
jgi:hypothetical protein